MKRIISTQQRIAGKMAIAAGSAFLVTGIVQLVHTQRHTGARVVGLAGHLSLSFFVLGLATLTSCLVALGQAGGTRASRIAGLTAAAGTTALAITCITSLIRGRDYGFFNVVGPITNVAWFAGSVTIAVALVRSGRLSTLMAIGLPLAWAATVILAGFGGGLAGGAYYLVLGYGFVAAPHAARAVAGTTPREMAVRG
jgi:hypothetical protein